MNLALSAVNKLQPVMLWVIKSKFGAKKKPRRGAASSL